MIEPLDTRLGALADPADDSSWLEVTTRARALRRRRRAPVAVAAALALAFVVVAPAVGLRDKIIQLFDDAAPAPERVERSFASLDQGVPPRLGTGSRPTARARYSRRKAWSSGWHPPPEAASAVWSRYAATGAAASA